ncbi:MAG: hypothetical protein HY231_09215 [Acidobacteria bacterium]|nr:hypothetical protein [Acidobacteriota bacterium]
MFEFTTEQSSITYRWTYATMLPSLPVPSTPAFAKLCRELKAYGMSPAGVSLEAPTAWLSDANFRILLLEERANLRFSFAWFELFVSNVSQGDESAITSILEAVFSAIRELDKDSNLGNAQISWNAHLSLSAIESGKFLTTHLEHGSNEPKLIPDAFAYKLKLENTLENREPRVVVANSAVFENAIFVSFSIVYVSPNEPIQLSEQFSQDTKLMLELLELK